MKIAEAIQVSTKRLTAYGTEDKEAISQARILIAFLAKCRLSELALIQGQDLQADIDPYLARQIGRAHV